MTTRRILIITVAGYEPPDSLEGLSAERVMLLRTDFDVASTLKQLGHDVRVLGLDDSIDPLRDAIDEFKPHVCFNLLEHFRGKSSLVPSVLGYLELRSVRYTGCNPIGMMFSTDKARQRKILRHHRIPAPDFFIVERGRKAKRPSRLDYPLIVKSNTEHGSTGIAEASVVSADDKLAQRVEHIHTQVGTDAIVERYVHGRELYCAILGNKRLTSFPLWELSMPKLREGAPAIATERIKWDAKRQDSVGMRIGKADIDDKLAERIAKACKRAYKALEQNGYARFDVRLAEDDRFYVIESNPNPQLAFDDEFADAAKAAGVEYPDLLERIISLALNA